MNELYLSKDTRELYLNKALPKKLKIKSEEHVEKWTQAFHQCRRELKETIVVVYCFVEPNCQLSSRSKPNKFQGETSTCSSLPCTSFSTPHDQSLYCLGVRALLLRFHWTPLNKLLSSPTLSGDPTCQLITGGYSLLEWELLLKLLKMCSLTPASNS